MNIKSINSILKIWINEQEIDFQNYYSFRNESFLVERNAGSKIFFAKKVNSYALSAFWCDSSVCQTDLRRLRIYEWSVIAGWQVLQVRLHANRKLSPRGLFYLLTWLQKVPPHNRIATLIVKVSRRISGCKLRRQWIRASKLTVKLIFPILDKYMGFCSLGKLKFT